MGSGAGVLMSGAFAGLVRSLSRSPRRVVSDQQGAFSDGLNPAADPAHVGPNEFVRAENCLLTSFGAIAKRRGTQRTHFQAFASAIQGGFSWDLVGSSTNLVVSGGILYTGVYDIPMVWNAATGVVVSTSAPIGFAPYTNGSAPQVYIADGGALNRWDGTTFTANIASTPNVSRLCVQNDRLWGISGLDNILNGSAIGNGSTLGISASGGGSFAIPTFGNGPIVDVRALGSSVMMIQRQGISRFTGWTADDFQVLTGTRGTATDVGSVCACSVVIKDDEGFFLSDRGFYSFTESAVRPESIQIRPMLSRLSQSDWENVSVAHYKSLYELRWFVPTLGVMVFNYALRKWTGPLTGTYLTSPVVAQWETLDTSSRPIVLAAHEDGFIRRTERPSSICKDDVLSNGEGGDRYALVAKCRRMFCNRPVDVKSYRFAYITSNLHTSDRAALICETDTKAAIQRFGENASGSWDEEGGQWDAKATGQPEPWYWGGVAYDRYKIPLAGTGEWVDLTIQDDGYGESVFARVDLRAYSLGER